MRKSASSSYQAAAAAAACRIEPTVEDLLNNKYLDENVAPALILGMLELVKERPDDPLGFLAAFLLNYKKEQIAKGSVSKKKD